MLTILHPTRHFSAFVDLTQAMRRYRGLTVEMARRELVEQYAGQVFGTVWVVVHPLFLMGLYVFIFQFVFKVRLGGGDGSTLGYTAYIMAGFLPWLGFQAVMARACSVLVAQANLVKQVVFPIEVLPLKTVLASFVTQLIGTAVFLAYVATQAVPPASFLLLPVLLLFQLMAMSGVAFALAGIGAFLRDIKDFVQLFATAGVYLVPVFYLPDWVPPLFKPVLYLNPFSYMIWTFQDALYFGEPRHIWAWPIFAVSSVAALTSGYRLFCWLKPHYGSVL